MMNTKLVFLLLFLVTAVSACSPRSEDSVDLVRDPADLVSQVERIKIVQRIKEETTGIRVGDLTSKHTAYVFFDPQCVHCSHLWSAAEQLESEVLFVWIPVDLLGTPSRQIAASILDAADPTQALRLHESSVKKDVRSNSESKQSPTEALVIKNRETLLSLVPSAPISSVPFTFAISPNGHVNLLPGAMSATELRAALELSKTTAKE